MHPLLRPLLPSLIAIGLFASSAQATEYVLQVPYPGLQAATSEPVPPDASVPDPQQAGAIQAVDSSDFGAVWVGNTLTRQFRLTNNGARVASAIAPVVVGPGLTISSSSCGRTASPVSLEAGASCLITLTYAPTNVGALSAASLSFTGFGATSPQISLTGQGWTEALGALRASTNADFGTLVAGTTASRSFVFTNNGNLAATNVNVTIPTVTGLTISANSCGTAASPVTVSAGQSCTTTLTYGGSTGSTVNGAAISVYGAFTDSPARTVLAGSVGTFNAGAAWSSSYSTQTPFTAANLSYGTQAVDTAVTGTRYFYIHRTGTDGVQSTGFQLSGDTQHFAIAAVETISTTGALGACISASGAISSDKLTAAPCTTGNNYTTLRLKVQYQPKATGTHNVTVTPSTNNGTALPGSIVLTGTGAFDATAVFSSDNTSTIPYANGTLTLAPRKKGAATITSGVFLRNIGQYGSQSTGIQLSGDTSQFQITQVTIVTDTNSASLCPGVIAADKASTTPCTGFSTLRHVRFQIVYVGTVVGVHSVTVTPLTDNGTALPAPLVIRGETTL